MKIVVKNLKDSAINLMRDAGYRFIRHNNEQMSFERRIGSGTFPRFHIYVSENNDIMYINLHIDQKRPSYSNSNMHNGEYGGEVINEEADRIKAIINRA